ncbi:MAG: GNAT family N-acetyltransferase [Bacteroidota bacterium]
MDNNRSIVCVPYEFDEIPQYLHLFADVQNLKYLDISCISPAPDLIDVFVYLSQPARATWFITHASSDTYIGLVSALCNRTHKTAVLTCFIDSKFHRHGYMKQALIYVQNKLFMDFEIIRIEAQVHSDNIPSVRLFERMGYLCEGKLRKNFVLDGVPGDSYMFSLLSDDKKSFV